MKDIGILFVHGVGNKNNREGWTEVIQKHLGDRFQYKESIWNRITQDSEDAQFKMLFPSKPSFWSGKRLSYYLRRFVSDFVIDATSYDIFKDNLMDFVEEDYIELCQTCKKVIIVGYSLGSWITYDLMRRADLKPTMYITFGCNIPLHRVQDYSAFEGVKWVNIWEYDDVLSMPLKREGIKDIEFKSDSMWRGWNVTSHSEYQTSRKFCKILVNELNEVLEAENEEIVEFI